MSSSPLFTSGRCSSLSKNPLLLAPPSIITEVSARARSSLASASRRSAPTAMILAIIESNCGGISSPSSKPVSMRSPEPPGRRNRSILPGAGAKPLSGSSAQSRSSTECPLGAGGSPSRAPPRATWSWSLTRSAPVTISVTGCSTWSRALTSMKEKASALGS